MLEVVTLRAADGGTAKILPGLGFNCFSYVPVIGGQPTEVLWAAPNFESGTEKPSRSGIPLLFPFAGRIRGTTFRYGGRSFTLDPSDPYGNAIHGFVIKRPWRVIEQTGTKTVGQFQASRDDSALLEHWPADFCITVSYELLGNALVSEIRIDNPDERPLPFGLGTHGYFRVPLGPGGQAAQCQVRVPATTNWELDKLLPTGREQPTPLPQLVDGSYVIGDGQLDHVLGGLHFADGWCTTEIIDAAAKRRLRVRFDDQFAACVVFNPVHREAFCIEPYTTIPDPFTLVEQGLDPHLRKLAPGESFATRIEMQLETTG